GHRAGGDPALQEVAGQCPAEAPQRAAAAREDAVVAGGMAGGQGVDGAQQIEDGAAAGGQDGRQQQDDKALVGGPREGSAEGQHERVGHLANGTRQRARAARPARGAAPLDRAPPAALPLTGAGALDLRSPRASEYSRHRSRWGKNQGSLTLLIPPQRL